MTRFASTKYIKKTVSFVKKWVNPTKRVDNLLKRGLVGKVTPKVKKRIVSLFSWDPKVALRQGATKLRISDLNESHEAIRQHLCAHDVKSRSRLKKPLLVENHVAQRLAAIA